MKELAKKRRGIPIGLLCFKAMLCQGSVTTWSAFMFNFVSVTMLRMAVII
jgi:hypothetical protein